MVIGGKFMSREGPAWLPPLLTIENFFSHCSHHTSGKNEKNHFCFDCKEGPLCPEGLAVSHSGHSTIQIRRASHRDVVRIADIQKYVDLVNIQPYTINSAKIVFLQSRPQPKMVKGASHYCETCHRSIADPVRFCSILCKLTAIRESPHDFSLTLSGLGKVVPSKGAFSHSNASPEGSMVSHGSGTMDFMPSTPTKSSKRGSNDTTTTPSPFFSSKKAKRNTFATHSPHSAVFGMSVVFTHEDDMGMLMYSTSPSLLAPLTPTFESGIRVHHRKQIRPHRAPMC